MKKTQGFTIIELLVVIAIIAILASIIIVNVSGYIVRARDAARKEDLRNIAIALEMYYAQNGNYPITGDPTGPDDPIYTQYSPLGPGGWIPELSTSGIMKTVPIDPRDEDLGPFCFGSQTSVNKIYTYASDGQHYILCAWMENHSDPATLQYRDIPNPWNTAQTLYASYDYSKYNYVLAK